MNGHNLKPGGFAAALAVLIAVVLASCSPKGAAGGDAACGLSDDGFQNRRHSSKRFLSARRSSTR